ncbi:MAG TPA: Bax inhibitor-1/YccA family protein [Baekduia sp.]|nr:Bax inhibitor-1/YccA family protein [Baekduia sp.]
MAFQTPGPPTAATEAFGRSDTGIAFLRQVFSWMFLGLLVTTAIAVYFSETAAVVDYFNDNPAMLFVLIGAQLVTVFALSLGINKISAGVAATMFLVYSALTGVTFALLLQVYTTGSVVGATAGAAGVFGGMAAVGYYTKKDLSKFGPILFGALIGLIVSSVVYMFVGGGVFNLIIGWAGVIIFAGLTAYDMQNIKEIGANGTGTESQTQKLAVIGALRLYLDFINLVISLLRIFGNNR